MRHEGKNKKNKGTHGTQNQLSGKECFRSGRILLADCRHFLGIGIIAAGAHGLDDRPFITDVRIEFHAHGVAGKRDADKAHTAQTAHPFLNGISACLDGNIRD